MGSLADDLALWTDVLRRQRHRAWAIPAGELDRLARRQRAATFWGWTLRFPDGSGYEILPHDPLGPVAR